MLSKTDSGARLLRQLGGAENPCGGSLCHLSARLLASILSALAPGAGRSISLQPGAGRSRTALLLIDVQPEWYTESQISQIFPGLRETIPRLLAMCRSAGAGPTYSPRSRAVVQRSPGVPSHLIHP